MIGVEQCYDNNWCIERKHGNKERPQKRISFNKIRLLHTYLCKVPKIENIMK